MSEYCSRAGFDRLLETTQHVNEEDKVDEVTRHPEIAPGDTGHAEDDVEEAVNLLYDWVEWSVDKEQIRAVLWGIAMERKNSKVVDDAIDAIYDEHARSMEQEVEQEESRPMESKKPRKFRKGGRINEEEESTFFGKVSRTKTEWANVQARSEEEARSKLERLDGVVDVLDVKHYTEVEDGWTVESKKPRKFRRGRKVREHISRKGRRINEEEESTFFGKVSRIKTEWANVQARSEEEARSKLAKLDGVVDVLDVKHYTEVEDGWEVH